MVGKIPSQIPELINTCFVFSLYGNDKHLSHNKYEGLSLWPMSQRLSSNSTPIVKDLQKRPFPYFFLREFFKIKCNIIQLEKKM